jgi:hypothetical protein
LFEQHLEELLRVWRFARRFRTTGDTVAVILQMRFWPVARSRHRTFERVLRELPKPIA